MLSVYHFFLLWYNIPHMPITPRPNFLSSERSPNTPERPVIPERSVERPTGTPTVAPASVTAPEATVGVASTQPTVSIPLETTSSEQRLRRILSEDMTELMAPLSTDKKQEVQAEGLKAIQKLQLLLRRTHLRFRQVLQLIWHWLKRIPGINRFFLEQEAKKKTEEILEFKEELDKQSS